jgi:hypothetical protein
VAPPNRIARRSPVPHPGTLRALGFSPLSPAWSQRIGCRICMLVARSTPLVRLAQVGHSRLGFPASLTVRNEWHGWRVQGPSLYSQTQASQKSKYPTLRLVMVVLRYGATSATCSVLVSRFLMAHLVHVAQTASSEKFSPATQHCMPQCRYRVISALPAHYYPHFAVSRR